MKEFRHPPTRGIKYCSILLWIESMIIFSLIPLTIFSEINTNTETEKVTFGISFLAVSALCFIAGMKLREAKKWAWIASITICFFSLGSPLFPFCLVALIILFKKNSVMYFTLPHIPNKKGANQSG